MLILKLRLLFWPFLRLLVLFAAGWAALNAALLTLFPAFNPPVGFWQGFLPFFMTAGLLPWQLRKPLGRIEETERSSNRLLLVLAAGATLVMTGWHVGGYFRERLGRLVEARTVADLGRHPEARYFRLWQGAVDNRAAAIGSAATFSSSRGTISQNMYLACPLLLRAADTASVVAPAWLGFGYGLRQSAQTPKAERDSAYAGFVRACYADLAAASHGRWHYLERAPNDNDFFRLRSAIANCPRYRSASAVPLVLLPRFTPFNDRAHDSATWLLGSFLGGITAVLLLVLVFPLRAEAQSTDAPDTALSDSE